MKVYLETETNKPDSLQRLIQKIKQITELIHEFVDKIVVYALRYLADKRVQLLDIYYSGMGILLRADCGGDGRSLLAALR